MDIMKNKWKKYGMYGTIAIWAVCCFLFFHLAYNNHLFYQEQNQLFLLSSEYVVGYFSKPAWLACLAGDFLTQFYYWIYVGPAILTIILLSCGDLMRRSLDRCLIGRRWSFLAAFLLMTLLAIFHFGTEYRLRSDIAIAGGLSLFILSDVIRRHTPSWLSCILALLSIGLSYWLFGLGCWFTALLTTLSFFRHHHPWRWLTLLSYPLLVLSALAFTNRHYLLPTNTNLLYPGIGKLHAPRFGVEQDLRIGNDYYFGRYDKVVREVESTSQPTAVQCFYYNLIQAQRGELPDHLMQFKPNELGTFWRIGPHSHMMVIKMMNDLYYTLGDMTFTERAAMMSAVFTWQNRNVRMTKRLAETAIVSGDTLAANKFLRLLDQTLVYRQWAKDHHIGAMSPEVQAEMDHKRKMRNQTDTVQVNDNLHMVMMGLLDSNPDNFVALDYMLCSDLLLKDMESFKRDYDRYCTDKGRPRHKKLYQQALMIYLAGTNAPQEQWKTYIVDMQEFARFQQYNQQRGSSQFADTYWYYFDKVPAATVEKER